MSELCPGRYYIVGVDFGSDSVLYWGGPRTIEVSGSSRVIDDDTHPDWRDGWKRALTEPVPT